MSDTVTVLVAAFGGGLAGAVLQPVVSYVLQRVRSKEEIRKRRERSLRRMLNWELAGGQQIIWLSVLIGGLDFAGVPPAPDEIRAMAKKHFDFSASKDVPWQPKRIGDGDLRQAASEYHEVVFDLHSMYFTQYDVQKAMGMASRLRELGGKIVARMDELNWPEADD